GRRPRILVGDVEVFAVRRDVEVLGIVPALQPPNAAGREIDQRDTVLPPVRPIGDPLTATTSVLPSGVRRTPRGRCPASIVFTTLSRAASITVTLFPRSSDTYTRLACAAGAAAASAVAAGFFSPLEHAAATSAPATMLLPNERPCHVPRIAESPRAEEPGAPERPTTHHLREAHSPPGQRRRIPAVPQQLGVKSRQ